MPLPLVERSEEEIAQMIRKRVEAIKDVRSCHQLGVRVTGKRVDVEMHVSLSSNLTFEDAHKVASDIEREVKSLVPNARVTIHTEPVGSGRESIWRLVKEIAEGLPGSRDVHNIHVQRINEKLYVDLHLEVSPHMTVKQAHDISEQVEARIKVADPNIWKITVHMETASDRVSKELAGGDTELEWYIEHVAKRFPEVKGVYGIKTRKVDENMHVVLRCRFDPNVSMKKAHEVSSRLEKVIRDAYPNVTRIDIHEEPA